MSNSACQTHECLVFALRHGVHRQPNKQMSFADRLYFVIQNILNSLRSSFPHKSIKKFFPFTVFSWTETNADTIMKKGRVCVCKHVWKRGMGTKALLRLLTGLKANLARCPDFSQLIPTGSRPVGAVFSTNQYNCPSINPIFVKRTLFLSTMCQIDVILVSFLRL